MIFSCIFSVIGAATTCLWSIQLVRYLTSYLRPSALARYNPPGKDAWALVTGATDGIGLGFAQELSKRGFNVFLHGRSREKLVRRQAELKAEYPSVQTKIIVSDAANHTEAINLIANEVGDTKLTVLVNNVGGEPNAYRGLTALSYQDVQNSISINATFMTQITRVLLPVLERNGPGLVMNISSVASYGMPYIPVYSGTKGFVDSFTRSLDAEMKADGKNVEVQGIIVGSVRSAGNDVEVSLTTPDSRMMASSALERVGAGMPLVYGYWGHALAGMSIGLIPRDVTIKFLANTMRSLGQQAAAKREKQS